MDYQQYQQAKVKQGHTFYQSERVEVSELGLHKVVIGHQDCKRIMIRDQGHKRVVIRGQVPQRFIIGHPYLQHRTVTVDAFDIVNDAFDNSHTSTANSLHSNNVSYAQIIQRKVATT